MHRADFDRVSGRVTFVAWAEPAFTHTNGSRYRYAIERDSPTAGFVWVLYVATLEDDAREDTRSRGAFYDDAEEHPEGAREWLLGCIAEHRTARFGKA